MIGITAARLSFGTVAAFTLLAGAALAVECGDVITGTARLDRDLICTTEPAVTVDGGTLDLRGFTVVCDETEVGILLEGRRARLQGGAVTGCVRAVWAAGAGDHIIRDVTASASNQGVFLESNRNRLVNSHILRGLADAAVQVNGNDNLVQFNDIAGSDDQGFEVNGNDNRFLDNRIGGVAEGFQLSGDGNQVLRNHIIGATDRGVEVRAGGHEIAFNLIADGGADGIALLDTGDGNHVHRNAVYGNADEGLEVATFDNRIEHNRVLLNGTDVQDSTPDCDDNLWRDNEFETSISDGCVD
jgi:Right handed beta helix region